MFIRESLEHLTDWPRYLYCLWRVSQLPKPIITVFGGKRAPVTSDYYKQAFDLGGKLVTQNMSVITGGGPGIMESALCGAVAQKKERSLGIGVIGVDVGFTSACNQETIYAPDFATRKKLLIEFSGGFVALPGGIGTLDEITEVLNLIKTSKIKQIPMILVGTEYWQPFTDWLKLAHENDYIAPEYTDLLQVTDDLDFVANQMVMHCIKGKR